MLLNTLTNETKTSMNSIHTGLYSYTTNNKKTNVHLYTAYYIYKTFYIRLHAQNAT